MTVSPSKLLLQHSSLQLLQNYQRCGLKWLPAGIAAASQDWPDEATLLADAQATSSASSGSRLRSEKPAAASAERAEGSDKGLSTSASASSPLKSDASVFPVSEPAQPSLLVNPKSKTAWNEASKSLEERQAIFSELSNEVRSCKLCTELACSRKQTVFGVGNLMPRVVFFGEAPGADEDRQGEPFVGAAGQLLNKIIVASKMRREDVYILNSLKCRPPGNRTPVDQEIANCRPYFEKQLEVLQPEFIVCLGAVAVRAVLQTNDPVGKLRGRFYQYRNAKVLVTYHPAYLLRTESAKRLVWDDMQMLMAAMGIAVPPKN
jgi:uracil-DNA glycosylase